MGDVSHDGVLFQVIAGPARNWIDVGLQTMVYTHCGLA